MLGRTAIHLRPELLQKILSGSFNTEDLAASPWPCSQGGDSWGRDWCSYLLPLPGSDSCVAVAQRQEKGSGHAPPKDSAVGISGESTVCETFGDAVTSFHSGHFASAAKAFAVLLPGGHLPKRGRINEEDEEEEEEEEEDDEDDDAVDVRGADGSATEVSRSLHGLDLDVQTHQAGGSSGSGSLCVSGHRAEVACARMAATAYNFGVSLMQVGGGGE